MSPDQFAAKYDGKLVNNGGTQCVAIGNQYQKEVVQGGWIGTPLTGYAIDWWANFGNDSDYDYYVRVGADQKAQNGDLAVWSRYNNNGLPHIALVLSDEGNKLFCLTQNPGNARKENLTKTGLAGYLRPKKFIAAPKRATRDQIMQAYRDILERDADEGGLEHYSSQTVEQVRDDLAKSDEKKQLDARKSEQQPNSTFSVGDVVVPTNLVDYDGNALTQWDDSYSITELIGDRAVLSARGAIWAAMNTASIRRA